MPGVLKNELHTVTIRGYSSSGDGIAHIDGQAVFIKGALQGEECVIRILKAGKTAAYAKIEEFIASSPRRLTPSCPDFGKCGGCRLMHMDYGEELRMKEQRVKDAITRIGGIEPRIEPIMGAGDIMRYRNKAIYAASAGGLGFYRERSHDVVPVKSCEIQAEASEASARAVYNWMAEYGVPAYDEKTGKGLIRHVFVRHAFKTNQTMVCVSANGSSLPHTGALLDALVKSVPGLRGVVLNRNKSRGNTVLRGEFVTLWGKDFIEDMLCGLRFKLSPRAFYQINREQAETLYGKVLEYAALTGKETVLDLFCGAGTITLCLAAGAKRVIGAEIVADAVRDAEENARQNGIKNAEFICADAGAAAKTLEKSGLLPDVIVVDPPRKGLAEDVIEIIARLSPARVVYVSCDPATLARDLKLFHTAGLHTEKITPLDMFPRCAHVECVALLQNINQHQLLKSDITAWTTIRASSKL